MAFLRNDGLWRWAIVAVAFGVVGCAVALNAPRPTMVPANVYRAPAPPLPAGRAVLGPRLPHEKHADLGLGCTDCHGVDEKTGEPTYPKPEVCLDCHQDIQDEAKTPPEKRVENLFFDPQGLPRWKRSIVGYPADVRFSHKTHATANLECAECHGKMKGTERVQHKVLQKSQCLACHQERDVSLQCAICHRATRADVPPPSHQPQTDWEVLHGKTVLAAEAQGTSSSCQYCHATSYCNECHQARKPSSHGFDWERRHGQLVWQAGSPDAASCTFCHRDAAFCDGCHQNRKPSSHDHLWEKRHGVLARAGDMSGMARCTFCHDKPSFCEDCHKENPPRDHTDIFRTRTHGMMASLDRTRCMVCHQTDFCVRCHEDTAPRSHRGLWAHLRDTHCMQCHFPIQQEPECAVCHKQNPTHDTAPDQPPSHTPGLNCRACHTPVGVGGAPPLRHVDNGTPCQFCHH